VAWQKIVVEYIELEANCSRYEQPLSKLQCNYSINLRSFFLTQATSLTLSMHRGQRMMKTYHPVCVCYAWATHFVANLPAVTTRCINEDQRCSLLSRTYNACVHLHVHINRPIYVVDVSDTWCERSKLQVVGCELTRWTQGSIRC